MSGEGYNRGERYMRERQRDTSLVPIFGIPWGDAYFIFGGIIIGTVIGSVTGSGAITLTAGFVGALLGFTVITASPAHITTSRWIQDVLGYYMRPSRIYSASSASEPSVRNDGGIKNRVGFEPDTRTEDMTGVQRAWVGSQAVLRSDGKVEGAIEISSPPNMDLATDQEWKNHQEAGKRYANEYLSRHETLDLHVTTEPFDAERMTRIFEDRLQDHEIRNRPVLRELAKELRDHRPKEMEEEGTQEIRYLLFLQVSPTEATTKYEGANTPLENLENILVLGPLVALVTSLLGIESSESSSLSSEERTGEMIETLDERLRELENEFVTELKGAEARRLSTIELLALGARFWNGNKDGYNDIEGLVRQQPIMRAASEVNHDDAPNPDPRPVDRYGSTGGDGQ